MKSRKSGSIEKGSERKGIRCFNSENTLIILSLSFLRNVSFGMNTFWARVGGMAAPQIFFLVSGTAV
jgi:hypothetical protein